MRLLSVLLASSALVACTPEVRQEYADALTKYEVLRLQEIDKADDAKCRREGAQPGTDFYNLCRAKLTERRLKEEAAMDARLQGAE
jgi:hypothetical protein